MEEKARAWKSKGLETRISWAELMGGDLQERLRWGAAAQVFAGLM